MVRGSGRERRKNEKLEDERQDAETWAVIETVLATPEQVIECRAELDEYDATTVAALLENNEALEAVRGRIDTILSEAYVFPDGRRVFKTRDGQHVFDVHGLELPPETINPDEIDNAKPRWEEFKGATDEGVRLMQERQQLLDFQTKLDEAREHLDKGDITQKELDQIKAGLAYDMPDPVQAKLGVEKPGADSAPARETKAIEATNAVPAVPTDTDALLRQTGLGPTGP